MAKKPRKDVMKEIEIPEGIDVQIEGNLITMKKDANQISKKISPGVDIRQESNKIILEAKKARREEKERMGTLAGHTKNMIKGLTEGFEYELEICNVHFPMTVEFDKTKREVLIKNIVGEKTPRKTKISDKVEIEIKAPKISIKSYDIEAAGQAAANLEKISRIRYRDRNKFQDGIFITKKPRKEFL